MELYSWVCKCPVIMIDFLNYNLIDAIYQPQYWNGDWRIYVPQKFIIDLPTPTQPAFICSNLTIETLEQGVKYAQIKQ